MLSVRILSKIKLNLFSIVGCGEKCGAISIQSFDEVLFCFGLRWHYSFCWFVLSFSVSVCLSTCAIFLVLISYDIHTWCNFIFIHIRRLSHTHTQHIYIHKLIHTSYTICEQKTSTQQDVDSVQWLHSSIDGLIGNQQNKPLATPMSITASKNIIQIYT